MTHPAKKILLATIVLAIGVGLSWPFRIQSEPSSTVSSVELALDKLAPSTLGSSPVDSSKRPHPVALPTRRAFGNETLSPARLTATELPPLPIRQVAKPITPRPPPPSLPSQYEAEFDLIETGGPRPVYATYAPAEANSNPAGDAPNRQPVETIHEVENSDTLAKLAKRYLGDPARALEIFDLNRDKLSNPHLLPIGAELRIRINNAK